MTPDKIRSVASDAITRYLKALFIPGIEGASLMHVELESAEEIAELLEQEPVVERCFNVQIEVLIRIGEQDVLRHEHRDNYLLKFSSDALGRVSSKIVTKPDWDAIWEQGIAPLKQCALDDMKHDVLLLVPDAATHPDTFRVAMILMASEMIGPYVERLASFTGYPKDFVQGVAARLLHTKLWNGDRVDCARWFDPKLGALGFMLDTMVALGSFERKWDEQKRD